MLFAADVATTLKIPFVCQGIVILRGRWLKLVPNNLRNNFFELDLKNWIYYNLKNMGMLERDEKWPCIFGVALWRI